MSQRRLDWNQGAALQAIERLDLPQVDRDVLKAVFAAGWRESDCESQPQVLVTTGGLAETSQASMYAVRKSLRSLGDAGYLTCHSDAAGRGILVAINRERVWNCEIEGREPGQETPDHQRALERLARAIEGLTEVVRRGFEALRSPSKPFEGVPHDHEHGGGVEFFRNSLNPTPPPCHEEVAGPSKPFEALRSPSKGSGGLKGLSIENSRIKDAGYVAEVFGKLLARDLVQEHERAAFFALCAWLGNELDSASESRVKSPGGWIGANLPSGGWQEKFSLARWHAAGERLQARLLGPAPAAKIEAKPDAERIAAGKQKWLNRLSGAKLCQTDPTAANQCPSSASG